MTLIAMRKGLAVAAVAGLTFHPTLAAAQQNCVTEDEVGAVAIYSVPSIIQAVRTKCGRQLTSDGYLARRGDALTARYAALQARVWPRAKSGMLKVLGGQANAQGRELMSTIGTLPDTAVRPLVDAWIVQEASAKIPASNCRRLEWVIEAMAPIDPEVAGGVLGAIVGLVDPDRMPVCPRRA
jgi:hypothetical protein